MDLERVEGTLDALEGQGARSFDAPACDCVRTLLTRAEEVDPAVGERLLGRAEAHLDRLRERFERHRARVTQALETLEQTAHGEQSQLRKQLERGELTRVARSVRKLSTCAPPPPTMPLPTPSAAASSALAESRSGPALPKDSQRVRLRRQRAMAYEDSVADLVASFALARAVDVVPQDAGPYNALRIASDALDTMRAVSPFYLTVQLNRLEELASLLTLPDLPEKPKPQPSLPAKRRGLKRGT